MKKIDLAQIMSIVANFGVIVGIVFLVVEIRQNTNALYGESRQAVLAASLQELFLVIENPDIQLSVIKEGPLTPEENVRLDTLYAAFLRAREFA